MRTRRHFLGLTLALTGAALVACGGSTSTSQGGAPANSAVTVATTPGTAPVSAAAGAVEILNVSYDPTRELYREFNTAFAKHWQTKADQTVTIKQSHGGSGSQARAVIEGLEAAVVTLALAFDIDALATQGGLIPANWESRLGNNSAPYTSTIVFLVRKGNPRGIKDWSDLVKPGVKVITPNPKTSGGARWNYLAAWGYHLRKGGNDASAKTFVGDLYKNVLVLDSGARGATTTFVERGIGDVLLAWENEAFLAIKELGPNKVEMVVPSLSILAEPPVTIVDKVVDKRGTRAVAQAYLDYLYTEEGQTIAGKNYYRPRLDSVAARSGDQFAKVQLFTIRDHFGSWTEAQKAHFADKGIFDQIYLPK